MGIIAQHEEAIREYISVLKEAGSQKTNLSDCIKLCIKILSAIVSELTFFDGGSSWAQSLSEESIKIIKDKSIKDEDIQAVLRYISAIHYEVGLRSGLHNSIDDLILQYFQQSNLPADNAFYRSIISFQLPRAILSDYAELIGNEKKEVENSITKWKEDVAGLEARVSTQETRLKDFQLEYNFVGLSKGFIDLIRTKQAEKKWLVCFIVTIGVLIIIIPSTKIGYFLFSSNSSVISPRTEFDWNIVKDYLPFLAIEIILIYFFRIFLQNYYSIKAQLLQLELRNSLCQFIEGYAAFAEKSAKAQLGKFESLIFSSISATIDRIPSTVDFAEQLVTLIKEVKK